MSHSCKLSANPSQIRLPDGTIRAYHTLSAAEHTDAAARLGASLGSTLASLLDSSTQKSCTFSVSDRKKAGDELLEDNSSPAKTYSK